MKHFALILLLLLCCLSARSQWMEGMLYLEGALSAEELEQDILDRYEYLHLHPLNVNTASAHRLSMLLSPYQIASLKDYRSRFGDILSPAELALVDGFGTERARAFSPFLSFGSRRLPGSAVKDTLQLHAGIQARADFKSVGGKARLYLGDVAEAGAAYRHYWGGTSSGTFFAQYNYLGGKVIAGDFNMRCGEGLMLWSGMQISQTASIDGFSKSGAGLSPSWSYTGDGTFRGFAAEYALGRFKGVGFVAEGACGGSLSYLSRSGTYGVNLLVRYLDSVRDDKLSFRPSEARGETSFNFKQRLWGMDLFGEAAWNPVGRTAAGVGGLKFGIGDNWDAALRIDILPSGWTGRKYGEYSALGGFKFQDGPYVPIAGKTGFGSSEMRHRLDVTGSVRLLPIPGKDPGRREEKITATWHCRPDSLLCLDTRAMVRLRNYEANRMELRTDATLSNGLLNCRLRLHGAWCEGPGLLGYLETGYTASTLQIWLRGTLYGTSGWSSRIYVYERDAPGGFSVPACYGEGSSVSLLLSHTWLKGQFRLRTYLRATYGKKKEKPGETGLKLQLMADF